MPDRRLGLVVGTVGLIATLYSTRTSKTKQDRTSRRRRLIAGIVGLIAVLASLLYFSEPWLHLDSMGRDLYHLFVPWQEKIELINKPRFRMGVGDGVELIPFSEELLFVESVEPVRLNIVWDSFLPDRAVPIVNWYETTALRQETSGHYSYHSKVEPILLTIQVLEVDLEGPHADTVVLQILASKDPGD